MGGIQTIGTSIRSLRKSKGMTLQQLSAETDLSIGYLSNLERNLSSPTLQNVQKICEVFGSSISDLLERNAEEKIVIRKKDREITISEEKNMILESIDFGMGNSQFLYMTIEPNSSSEGLWWTHKFDEVGTVISGELVIIIDDQTFLLHEGDTILIKENSRHCYFNNSETEPSVTYWSRYFQKEISEK